MMSLQNLIRPNIYALEPYSSARDEYKGKTARVFLDANESPFNTPQNRYPDPLQTELKTEISKVKGIRPDCIFLGNGSDEAIDLIFRIFCIPGRDNVVAIEPTYGMYSVCANINDIEYRRARLDSQFNFSAENLLRLCNERTKAIFLCSPNNPSGNLLEKDEIEKVLDLFEGIVVVDEAYTDFAPKSSLLSLIAKHDNLIILQTFSKAWASAGIRLGMVFAIPEIIHYFNKVKYPYNVNILTQNAAMEMIKKRYDVEKWVKQTIEEREKVVRAIRMLPFYVKDYPTQANFFLVKVENAGAIYNYLVDKGIIVRNRSKITLCEDCLRITIGLPSENSQLLSALRQYREG